MGTEVKTEITRPDKLTIKFSEPSLIEGFPVIGRNGFPKADVFFEFHSFSIIWESHALPAQDVAPRV